VPRNQKEICKPIDRFIDSVRLSPGDTDRKGVGFNGDERVPLTGLGEPVSGTASGKNRAKACLRLMRVKGSKILCGSRLLMVLECVWSPAHNPPFNC